MPTRFPTGLVSPLLLAVALATGACARVPSTVAWDETAATTQPAAIRFDNDAEVYVDVYLITDQREWRLGRVEAGGRATLQLPEAALAATRGFVTLAVLADAPPSLAAARDPRAALTIAQPLSELRSQRWMFSRRLGASPQLLGVVGR